MAFGSIMSQKPNAYTDDEVLTDETKAIYGLGPEAVPDDVFIILGIGAGKYGYGITVTYPDGTPAANLPVTGVTDRLGQPITTNDKGYFLAVSTAKSITFSIVSPYFDLDSISNQTVNYEDIITKKNMSLSERTYTNYILVQNTQTIKFFKDRTVDFTAVGGGGGGIGANRKNSSSSQYAGAGGGGGYVKTLLSKFIYKNQNISIQIGSGGFARSGIYQSPINAGNGGSTIVSVNSSEILKANGGNGAMIKTIGTFASPGLGNGNGGRAHANNATNGSGNIFNESNLGVAGGGGGGGAENSPSTGAINKGGKPYGANGSYRDTGNLFHKASTAGIGGGGGGGEGERVSAPSAGGAGAVYIRWK